MDETKLFGFLLKPIQIVTLQDLLQSAVRAFTLHSIFFIQKETVLRHLYSNIAITGWMNLFPDRTALPPRLLISFHWLVDVPTVSIV